MGTYLIELEDPDNIGPGQLLDVITTAVVAAGGTYHRARVSYSEGTE